MYVKIQLDVLITALKILKMADKRRFLYYVVSMNHTQGTT